LESANGTLRLTGVALLLLGLAILAPQSRASSPYLSEDLKVRQLRAQQFEALGQWDKACEEYNAILRCDRNLVHIRESYLRCLRRYHLVYRHRDFSYRKEVLGLKYSEALRLCELVLTHLMDKAVERHRAQPVRLLRYGIEELSFALSEPEFRQEHMPNVKNEAIETFRTTLQNALNGVHTARSRRDVLDQIRRLAMSAQQTLGLNAVVTVLECTCGACAAVDEYTLFLSPNQLHELVDACKGTFVGVGLKVRLEDNKLIISEIVPGSPAAEAMIEDMATGMKTPALQVRDHLVSICRRSTADLTPEAAMELLEGEAGTIVDLIVDTSMAESRLVLLKRRPMFVPSISKIEMKGDGIGYLQITCFQETTIQELDDAILALNKAGMKALVLDLRGNGGGVFDVAVEVSRRFLASGVIVSTQHADARLNMTYHARNLGAWGMPVVVLVDGNTASSAEVLAGALKENRRARLVGQTTFGKGYSQILVRLNAGANGALSGGLRLTVAKFFSPLGNPYAGRGILPHIIAEPADDADSMNRTDHPLEMARLEAQKLLVAPR
jgi:carboxyl-terminal processing protease